MNYSAESKSDKKDKVIVKVGKLGDMKLEFDFAAGYGKFDCKWIFQLNVNEYVFSVYFSLGLTDKAVLEKNLIHYIEYGHLEDNNDVVGALVTSPYGEYGVTTKKDKTTVKMLIGNIATMLKYTSFNIDYLMNSICDWVRIEIIFKM